MYMYSKYDLKSHGTTCHLSEIVIRAPGPGWAPGGAEGLRDPCPSSQTSVPRQKSGRRPFSNGF